MSRSNCSWEKTIVVFFDAFSFRIFATFPLKTFYSFFHYFAPVVRAAGSFSLVCSCSTVSLLGSTTVFPLRSLWNPCKQWNSRLCNAENTFIESNSSQKVQSQLPPLHQLDNEKLRLSEFSNIPILMMTTLPFFLAPTVIWGSQYSSIAFSNLFC